jgi:hypothetical protein
MKISNVAVNRESEHGDYCLAWRGKDAQYHVWLAPDDYTPRTVVGQRGAEIYKRDLAETYASKCRFLKLAIPKNKAMFQDAMAEATAQHLFEKCNANLLEREQKRLAEAHAAYLIELQHRAGPEMFAVLKAIDGFFATNENFTLAPGAQILQLGRETIADAVRRVVKLAENGEGVPL